MNNIHVDYKKVMEQINNNQAVLLDVRSQAEWNQGHAKNAKHLDVNDIINGETVNLSKDKRLYIYCRTGRRAGVAAQFLKNQGYDAENIGGLSDWAQAGGKVVND